MMNYVDKNPPVESVEAKEVRSLSNFGARANPDPVVTSPRSPGFSRGKALHFVLLGETAEKRGKTPQKLHQTASNIQNYPDISQKKN